MSGLHVEEAAVEAAAASEVDEDAAEDRVTPEQIKREIERQLLEEAREQVSLSVAYLGAAGGYRPGSEGETSALLRSQTHALVAIAKTLLAGRRI